MKPDALMKKLTKGLGDSVLSESLDGPALSIGVRSTALAKAAAGALKAGFAFFSFVTAVDRGAEFELVYHTRSWKDGAALFIRTSVPRDEALVATVTDVWPGAGWHEREVADLFGIVFAGHPDPRPLVLPDNWVGHPLRKDYEDDWVVKRPELW